MEWIKNYIDFVALLLAYVSCILFATFICGKINDVEKDIAIIKTVLVMKNIMPAELFKKEMEK